MAPSRVFNDADVRVNIGSFEDCITDDLSKSLAASAQARMLLQALQGYILPLVNSTENDMSQMLWGSEASKLLVALQEFISAIIIRSQSENQNGIEVNLQDNKDTTTHTRNDITSNTMPSSKAAAPSNITTRGSKYDNETLEQTRRPRGLDKVLVALRERVYNTMPIRLLHFTPRGSKLSITLIQRSEVYTIAAAKLQASYSEADFDSKVAHAAEVWPWIDGSHRAREQAVIDDLVSQHTGYAILSHTWIRTTPGEITHGDWQKRTFDTQQLGYQKLVNFCRAAWRVHRLAFGWMDTICIDKESSSELDESIRSMHKWYKDANICITYLAETNELSEMHKDIWFTRGWTFQELLAPQNTKFYNRDWKHLIKYWGNDKDQYAIRKQIHRATTITSSELQNPGDMPISRKMQLAAKREVMREEDIAYSLMGICDVSISIAYGEGANRAFSRLIEEILNSSHYVFDIFNCSQIMSYSETQQTSSLIPSGPLAYLQRSIKLDNLDKQKPVEPLILTHLGLRIPILLMPALPEGAPRFQNDPIGDYYATVNFRHPGGSQSRNFCLLDKGVGISPQQHGETWTLNGDDSSNPNQVPWHITFAQNTTLVWRLMNDGAGDIGAESDWDYNCKTFGILNFGGDNTNIDVPNTCLAVGFNSHWNEEWESTSKHFTRYYTKDPVVFKLRKRNTLVGQGYSIKRSELAKHGMRLVTMHL